jgi:hypothetical protein
VDVLAGAGLPGCGVFSAFAYPEARAPRDCEELSG